MNVTFFFSLSLSASPPSPPPLKHTHKSYHNPVATPLSLSLSARVCLNNNERTFNTPSLRRRHHTASHRKEETMQSDIKYKKGEPQK